jgi:hypothetical protein
MMGSVSTDRPVPFLVLAQSFPAQSFLAQSWMAMCVSGLSSAFPKAMDIGSDGH